MLTIEHLTKTYGGPQKAVDDLSLALRPGEIYGFLGPNGAGKTTTIKIVTGILQYKEGRVTVCGHDLATNTIEAKRHIGYVSDSHILYDRLTGREYVNFLADVYGVDVATRKKRAEELLESFELTSAYDSQISTSSHGMKQKINVIGALIHDPDLWILDEPMTGLDPQSAFILKERMRAHCNAGKTVFFSTHVLEVAEKLCDRVGIIVKGKLLLEGTLSEIHAAKGEGSLEEVFLSVAGGESSDADKAGKDHA